MECTGKAGDGVSSALRLSFIWVLKRYNLVYIIEGIVTVVVAIIAPPFMMECKRHLPRMTHYH